MSKKHFIALADAMRVTRPESSGSSAEEILEIEEKRLEQWKMDRDHLAYTLHVMNPRFNREQWLAYIAGECGPNGGKIK